MEGKEGESYLDQLLNTVAPDWEDTSSTPDSSVPETAEDIQNMKTLPQVKPPILKSFQYQSMLRVHSGINLALWVFRHAPQSHGVFPGGIAPAVYTQAITFIITLKAVMKKAVL